MTYNAKQRRKQSSTIKGVGNPNWKGGRIQKICVRCSSPFMVYPGRKDSQMHCSLKCANRDTAESQKGIVNPKKILCGESNGSYGKGYLYQGELNPNWKGGTTKENAILRTVNRYYRWRDKVFIRDDYTCQDCGKRGGDLEAHHIKSFANYPEARFAVSNGQTLCLHCHRKTFGK